MRGRSRGGDRVLNIELPQEIEEPIKGEAASGRFASASEFVADAMRAWQNRGLREAIAQGDADFERGNYVSLSGDFY